MTQELVEHILSVGKSYFSREEIDTATSKLPQRNLDAHSAFVSLISDTSGGVGLDINYVTTASMSRIRLGKDALSHSKIPLSAIVMAKLTETASSTRLEFVTSASLSIKAEIIASEEESRQELRRFAATIFARISPE